MLILIKGEKGVCQVVLQERGCSAEVVCLCEWEDLGMGVGLEGRTR